MRILFKVSVPLRGLYPYKSGLHSDWEGNKLLRFSPLAGIIPL